jgi:DNA sulfur modification protein DndD
MILKKLVLFNFGIYAGRHTIDLTSNKKQPIVIIGALNGSGKTTLLESIQFGLFGNKARFIPRSKSAYIEFLQASINRKNLDTSASVSVIFETKKGRQSTIYEVVRTWTLQSTKNQQDTVQVFKNDVFEEELSDRWPELSENFFPSQLSDLFFFDGERIENLAQQDRCSELIRTGLNSLLGLDLVSDLAKTLSTLERKIKLENSSVEDKIKFEKYSLIENKHEQDRDKLASELEEVYTERTIVQKSLDIAKQILIREGGELFNNREALKSRYDFITSQISVKRTELIEITATALPLTLLEGKIKKIEELSLTSLSITQKEAVSEAISNFSECILKEIEKRKFEKGQLSDIRKIHESYLRLDATTSSQPEIHCSRESLYKFRTSIAALQSTAMTCIVELTKFQHELSQLEKQLSAVPATDKVMPFLDEVKLLENQLLKVQVQAEEINIKIQINEKEIQFINKKKIETVSAINNFKAEEILFEKMREQLKRGRDNLARFEEEIRNKHVSNLEKGIKESFESLLRKKGFLHGISIDKNNYLMTINIVGGSVVPASKLSAGERQLLAVAVLWALAKLSGRQLPTVIDTPLGRLDSKHRKFFVENYFPQAGHQVILLSTDEEIVGEYYKSLHPFISKEYIIEYDETAQSSIITSGYFQQTKVQT